MNLILITVLFGVLHTCFCYKLRRDIRKIKYYCNDICKSCGGEGELNFDVCVCNFEKETVDSQECVNKNRNKFDFLGIKWEVSHESVKKRSVSTSDYTDFTERKSYGQNSEQNKPSKKLLRRSHNFPESDYPRFQWRVVGNPEKLQDVISNPRLVFVEHSKKSVEPVVKRTNLFRTKSDLTRFAADMFQPIPDQLHRQKAEFKVLLDEPVEYLKRQLYHELSEDSEVHENDKGSVDDEDFDSDYEDESECGDDILARLENLPSGVYDSGSSQEVQYDFETSANDKIDEKSDWETVSPKVYTPNSHRPLQPQSLKSNLRL